MGGGGSRVRRGVEVRAFGIVCEHKHGSVLTGLESWRKGDNLIPPTRNSVWASHVGLGRCTCVSLLALVCWHCRAGSGHLVVLLLLLLVPPPSAFGQNSPSRLCKRQEDCCNIAR